MLHSFINIHTYRDTMSLVESCIHSKLFSNFHEYIINIICAVPDWNYNLFRELLVETGPIINCIIQINIF